MKKRIFIISCFVICISLFLSFVGCESSNYSANEKTQPETEKELVDLLRQYDALYKPFTESEHALAQNATSKIKFAFKGDVLFTSDNFRSITLSAETLIINLDTLSTETLAQISSENIGEYIDILKCNDESIETLSQPIIESPILHGTVYINNHSLYNEFSTIYTNTQLTKIANTYNTKRSAYHVDADYLPDALALPPLYTDVTRYLEKADIKGF